MARQNDQKRQLLSPLADIAVPGTLVEVYLRCGTASCRCHRDPERRHGPHLYLKFRSPKGHSTSLYVPRSHEEEARKAVAAWTELRAVIAEMGDRNREVLRERVRRKGNKRAARK